MDIPAYKIWSGECNNCPLIKYIAGFGKPIILSTGMNRLERVSTAADILEIYNVPYALLHKKNLYPTPPHLVHLGAVENKNLESSVNASKNETYYNPQFHNKYGC